MASSANLTPAVFHILLALSAGEKHGYEIMKQVRLDSHDAVKIGTGTLYGSLKRMLAAGLVEETGERPDALDDQRRRYYRATARGSRALAAELNRYQAVVSVARRRGLRGQASVPQPR